MKLHSMVDTEGPLEVASQISGSQRGEHRKIDQVVHELVTYGVEMGALQYSKWFGHEVYEVGGNVVLNSWPRYAKSRRGSAESSRCGVRTRGLALAR